MWTPRKMKNIKISVTNAKVMRELKKKNNNILRKIKKSRLDDRGHVLSRNYLKKSL